MQFKVGHSANPNRLAAYVILCICSLVLSGGGFIAAVLYYASLHNMARYRRLGQLCSLLWSVVLVGWVMFAFSSLSIIAWYILTIPLAPLGASLIAWLVPLIQRVYATDLDEKLALQIRDQQQGRLHKRRKAIARGNAARVGEHIPLASVIETPEAFPSHTGIRQQQGWLYLSETALTQHLFVLGSPGSGKSEMLKYLAYQILKHTDYDLFFIDGKGDSDLADFLRDATRHARDFTPATFRLGHVTSGDPYNAFVGQKEDIYNRLVRMIDSGQAQGGAAYYANANKTLLQLICYAPEGAPRDFSDLERRLNRKWLTRAYYSNQRELENIEAVKKHMDDVGVWMQPLIRDFRDLIHRGGFTFDDARVAVFSIRTQSVGETSRQLLNVMNADLMDFMGKRQQRPAVVICDEFQAFKNETLAETLSLGRSSKLAVVLATQDTASIGNPDMVRRILANTKTKILMATDFPEDVGQIAGTQEILEHSYQHDEGQVTGVGTSRLQHQYAVPLNDVARLMPGEAFVIRQRYSSRVQFRMVEEHQLRGEV